MNEQRNVKEQNRPRNGSRPEDSGDQAMNPANDIIEYVHQYAKDQPEMFAMWCFGIGFVLGWKLKPW